MRQGFNYIGQYNEKSVYLEHPTEWVWTSDIGKYSKNNFPFEKESMG